MGSYKKWKITFSNKADRSFQKLDKKIQTQVLHYFDKISVLNDPRIKGAALKGNLRAYWKYRIGDFRALCQIKDDTITISVVKIAHRREVYATLH